MQMLESGAQKTICRRYSAGRAAFVEGNGPLTFQVETHPLVGKGGREQNQYMVEVVG